MAPRRWNVEGPVSRPGTCGDLSGTMGNIPDFDPDAYRGDALGVLDLVQLSHAYDSVQTVRVLLEEKARGLRRQVCESSQDPDLEALKDEMAGAYREVTLIRYLAREVRQTFARRLREAHGAQGLLVDNAVYLASRDMHGIQRIELANPPRRPAAAIGEES